MADVGKGVNATLGKQWELTSRCRNLIFCEANNKILVKWVLAGLKEANATGSAVGGGWQRTRTYRVDCRQSR